MKYQNKFFTRIFFCTVLLLVFSANITHAQYDGKFEQLSIKDGLSNNKVFALCQDKNGYLWMATEDGLNKYDGYNFEVFKNIPGDSTTIPDNIVWAVMETKSGDIWIGSKRGLSKYDRKNNIFRTYTFSKGTTENANAIFYLLEDSKSNIWLSTESGVLRFDRASGKFHHYDVMLRDNTIAQFVNSVYRILETKSGSLYASTISFGIVKFDYSANIFMQLALNKDDLIHFAHYDMIESDDGTLWVAAFHGLYRVNPALNTIENLNPFKKVTGTDAAYRNSVTGVYKDRYGNIWIGTAAQGLYVYYSAENKFKQLLKPRGADFFGSFFEDSFGVLWLKGGQGLLKYDFNRKPFALYTLENSGTANNKPFVTSFNKSDIYKNLVWLGTSSGLYQYDIQNEKVITDSYVLNKINNPNRYLVTTVKEYNGTLWFGTRIDGLFKYNPENNRITQYKVRYYDNSLNADRIFTILQIDENQLWIGTDFGINVIDTKRSEIASVPSFFSRQYNKNLSELLKNLDHSTAPAAAILKVGDYADISKEFVLTEQKNIIIASMGEGLFQWNMVDYGWLESSEGDTLWSSKEFYSTYHAGGGQKNRLKIGMLKLEKGRYRIRYISDDSHSAAAFNNPPPQDSLNWGIRMYALTNEIFNKYESVLAQSDSTTYTAGEEIQSLFRDSKGFIWAGTNRGISCIDPTTHEVKNYKASNSEKHALSNNTINAITESLDGSIWIGTSDGLNKLNPATGEFTVFREKDGLPSNQIRSMQIDNEGGLWAGTINGLSKLELNVAGSIPVIVNYDIKDGLQGYEFLPAASYKDETGKLYFSGLDGFNVFAPGKSNNTLPYLVINDIIISNKSIHDKRNQSTENSDINDLRELNLSYDNNDISIDFASIHFSRPDKNRLLYKMDGFDPDWQSGQRRFASYTNLSSGDYIFRVKGANGDGIWNEESKVINIHISPPWYNNWFAYIIYVVVLAGMLFSVRKLELGRKMRLIQLEETRLRAQTAELQAKSMEAEKRLLEAEYQQKKKELAEARNLQLSMLPKKLPELPHLDIAVYMKTATEVGGDYYDFHVGMDGTLTVVIGDATGHGMKAGTMVTTAKSLFHSYAPNPDILFSFREITRCIKQMNFNKLSMCMTMLKIQGNKMIMSSAGMPPSFIFRRETRSIEEHLLQGMPLGTMDKFPYELEDTTLKQGDTILLLSDGLPEFKNDTGESYGYKRLRNAFEEVAEKDLEEMIGYLKNEGSVWVNHRDPEDDVTFVVIRVK